MSTITNDEQLSASDAPEPGPVFNVQQHSQGTSRT